MALPVTAHEPTIVTFDAPGAGQGPGTTNCYLGCPGTVAQRVNSAGTATGYYIDNAIVYHGFVRYPNGVIVTFDAPGAGTGAYLGTLANSINSNGTVAGALADANALLHGFLRSPDGHFTIFDAPGAGTSANQGTWGSVINNMGAVAGYYVDANNSYHGFVRYRDGRIESFDAPGAGTGPYQGTQCDGQNGLNSEGAITGWYSDASGAAHGYVRSADGTITDFDNPDGGTGPGQGTFGASINSQGKITGGSLDSNLVYHGFLRSPDGNMDTFEAPGSGNLPNLYQGTFGTGINAAGTIVAYSTDSMTVSHGAIRERDGSFTVFDAPGAGNGIGQGTTPSSINNGGVISGLSTDANNVNHGFLRYP
jgi:hypothetical protein